MNTGIFIEFSGNKIKFIIKLDIDLIEKNKKEYFKLDDEILYETDNINFDKTILNNKIKLLNEKIKKSFNLDSTPLDDKDFSFISNDYFLKESKIGYNFFKEHEELKITLITSDYKKLITEFGENDYKNIKILFENSTDRISYIEFYKMYQKLNEIIEFIKYYNLTPLEQIFIAYDIVKANEYKKETELEDYSDSRNLNRILNNDKIVCVGFANLLNFILKNLGFETTKVTVEYTNKNVGHIRNEVYIKDDFYNIDGNFFLDATWDSKKDENYIDNYYYFLKPIRFFKKIKIHEEIITPKLFKILEKSDKELLECITDLSSSKLFEITFNLETLINRNTKTQKFSPKYIKSKEELEYMINKVYKKYNQTLSKETFKNALYKVRKIEYLNNIINFIPNEEYLEFVCDKYYKDSPEMRFLQLLGITFDIYIENLYNNSSNIDEDMLKIRLLRTLKTKIEDFPKNQYIKRM